MILLDAVNTKYRTRPCPARRGSILEQIEPAERVAIYALGSRFRVIHNFSSDRASLLAKLRAYHGRSARRDDLLDDIDLDQDSHTPPPPPQLKASYNAGRIVDTLQRSKPSPTM